MLTIEFLIGMIAFIVLHMTILTTIPIETDGNTSGCGKYGTVPEVLQHEHSLSKVSVSFSLLPS
jgi:hypothetical protein